MLTTKLTLSADKHLIIEAKRIAESQGTSVSAMFMRFIQAMKTTQERGFSPGPVTRQAAGMMRVSSKMSDRQLIEEALLEKFR